MTEVTCCQGIISVVKAWQAGIDVALLVQKENQTPTLAVMIDSIVAKAKAALRSGELHTNDFNASVGRILTRKGIDACKL
jgi:hypothetical protein